MDISRRSGKWCAVFGSILLAGSLLLTGCTQPAPMPEETGEVTQMPSDTENTQPTEDARPTENSQPTEEVLPTEDTLPAETEPPVEGPWDASLVSLRQAMVETPQIFAVAYFGYVPQDADPFAVMQEAAPQLCQDLPFLLTIDREHILGDEGQLFCIVPADEIATVAVNRRPWNAETESYEDPEVLYRSESGAPILVMCPNEDWIPDTEVIITDQNGTVTVWSPYLDPSYHVSGLLDDNGESLLFDFTSYEELPSMDPGTDAQQLVGSWGLTWTEVEGDRVEAAPGSCTLQIVTDETGSLRASYSDKDFPEDDYADRAVTILPGALYPGCSNDRWYAEVSPPEGAFISHALTLLEDGTLLVQSYWEMEGIPMVSYGSYARIG